MLKEVILQDLPELNMELIEAIEKLYLYEENRHGDRTPYRTIIDDYINKKYINSPEYIPDQPYFDYLNDVDPEIDLYPLIDLIEESFKHALEKITVLDSDLIMEAIFTSPLEKYELKENNFPLQPSPSYNDDNRVRLQGGVIFKTTSGKDGKLRPYFKLNMKEKGKKSGETPWVSSNKTLYRIREGLSEYFCKSDKKIASNFDYLGVKKDAEVSKLIITTGPNSDMYLIDEANLENLKFFGQNDYKYANVLFRKTHLIIRDEWKAPSTLSNIDSKNKTIKKTKKNNRDI